MPQAEGHARNCMDTEPRQISATYPGSRTALCQNGLPYCATRFAALTKSCQLALLADIPKRHSSTVRSFSPVRGVFLPLRHLILSTQARSKK